MNLNGKAALATDEDLATYDRKLSYLERELERRMALGQQFEAVLDRQEQLMVDDETGRENHQVSDGCGGCKWLVWEGVAAAAVRMMMDDDDGC